MRTEQNIYQAIICASGDTQRPPIGTLREFLQVAALQLQQPCPITAEIVGERKKCANCGLSIGIHSGRWMKPARWWLRPQTSLFHVGIDVKCIGKEVGLALQPCIQHLACFKHTHETPKGGRWPINLCLNYLLPLGIMEHSGASTTPPSKISQPHQILCVQELCCFPLILSLRFGWSKKEWDWKLLPPC